MSLFHDAEICRSIIDSLPAGVCVVDMQKKIVFWSHRAILVADAPTAALSTMADSLPGLGIVAAVLGVVITMGALGGPPEEIGNKVAAALVGTFLGILLCYGLVGPLA